MSANEVKKAKISSRIEHLKKHVEEVHRQKEALNDRLCANNESVGRVQAEINAACGDSNKPGRGVSEREIGVRGKANRMEGGGNNGGRE